MATFKYVVIPADSNDPIEEHSMRIPKGKEVECFLDHVKTHFRSTGGERTEAQRQAQREQLVKQLGEAASNLNSAVLENAINMQMVENICLLPNSPETGYAGINLYCDDQAQLKGLEPNPRATQMAQCCGKLIEVRGDAFVARVFDNEDDFKRLDFTMQEVSSSAPWVKQAADIARRKQDDSSYGAQKDFLDRLNQKRFDGSASASESSSTKQHAAPSVQVRELTPAELEKDEGNAAFKKGDWQTAISRYTAALALDPGLLPALNNRALALLKLQRFDEAEQDCSKVLEKEPANVKALLRRATAREHAEGKRLLALEDVEAALRLEPGNKEAQAAQQRLLPPPPPRPEAAGGY